MKKTVLLILLIVLGINTAYSESLEDQVKNYASSKDYLKAAALIPDLLKENPKDNELFLLLGDIYMELDKVDSALIMFEKSDQLDRNEPPTLRRLAQALSMVGKYDEAVEKINDAIEEEPDNINNIIEKGMIYVRKDDLQNASLEFNKAKAMNDKLPAVYVAQGDLYFKKGIYEMARKNYEDALSLDPSLIQARINLAESYSALANSTPSSEQALIDEYFNKSLKEWNTISREDPKNARAFLRQGKIYYQASRYGDAAKGFDRYIKLRPDDANARWLMAQSLFKIQKYDLAIEHLEIVRANVDTLKQRATVMLARCWVKYAKDDENGDSQSLEYNQKAVELYNEYLQKDTLDNIDLSLFASATLKTGDTLTSFDAFRRLFRNDTTQTSRMGYIAGQLYKMNQYEEAASLFLRVAQNKNLDSSIDAPKMLYYVASCYRNAGAPEKAFYYLNKSLEENPMYVKSYLLTAESFQSLDELDSTKSRTAELNDSAEVYFNKTIEMGMKDTASYKREIQQAYQNLISMYLKGKKYSELQVKAKAWTEFDPTYSNAWFFLGVSYQGQKDTQNACRYYRKALQLDSKNKHARKYYNLNKCGESAE